MISTLNKLDTFDARDMFDIPNVLQIHLGSIWRKGRVMRVNLIHPRVMIKLVL